MCKCFFFNNNALRVVWFRNELVQSDFLPNLSAINKDIELAMKKIIIAKYSPELEVATQFEVGT